LAASVRQCSRGITVDVRSKVAAAGRQAGRRDMTWANSHSRIRLVHRIALPAAWSDGIAWHIMDPSVVRVAYHTRDGLTPPSPPARMGAAGKTVCKSARLGQKDGDLDSIGVSEVVIRVTACPCAYTNETCKDSAPANRQHDHNTTRPVHVRHSTHMQVRLHVLARLFIRHPTPRSLLALQSIADVVQTIAVFLVHRRPSPFVLSSSCCSLSSIVSSPPELAATWHCRPAATT
jgi:hypothetical protein